MNLKNLKPKKAKNGSAMIFLIIVVALFSILMLPVLENVIAQISALRSAIDREEALQIAEAGINYYQWHLAHFPTDYQDGTGQAGPYVHDYVDKDTQEIIGQFSLVITPPSTGSTITTVQSTGWTSSNPTFTRRITAKFGIPSLSKYAFLSNDIIWIGSGESVSGQMHCNNGIRFDGSGNAPIQSAKTTYTCPSSQGSPCPTLKDGIWGSASQQVKNFWSFPVPAVDFSTLTTDLAGLKSAASTPDGIYLPPSGSSGYSLVFNSNGTVSIYKITSLRSTPTCQDVNGNYRSEDTDYYRRTLQYTKNLPANGIIYIEDKVWVEGTVHGRVTVAAAKLPYNPSTAPSIYISKNIVYSAKDGSDVLGLIAQRDIIATYYAASSLEVDAALIAQNGSAQFFYCNGNIKDNITIYGAIMSYGQWTWTWVNGYGTVTSGYRQTSSNYDSNLLYGPPPSFPLSTSDYQLISWTSE